MADLGTVLKVVLNDVVLFAQHLSGIKLRAYQKMVAQAVVDSVVYSKGKSFVVIFPRQSGKNELQAQIETYLLTLLLNKDAEIVKISPTWKPQSLNAMRRLERVMKKNTITRRRWCKEQGYIYKLDSARIFFFSGEPTANIVGATASTLLEVDEAQDVLISKYDKDISPMAASTNATRVFWGTAWTSQTLLAREKRAALEAEKADGERRVFEINADIVGLEVPEYATYVKQEIEKHGRNNPFIKTQYFSEEIDESAGLFTPERLALLAGDHPPAFAPISGCVYVFAIDVAGSDENSLDMTHDTSHVTRDSTVLTIAEVELHEPVESVSMPQFKIVNRRLWTGESQVSLFRALAALAQTWDPRWIVIDATGVGEGLASFLGKTYPSKVIPFKFTASSKSELGWKFISLLETGRYKEYTYAESGHLLELQEEFYRQCKFCTLEILPGPNKTIRWGVPDGTRDPASGELVHDDLVLSAALLAALEDQTFGTAESAVLPAFDPLKEMRF